MINLSVKNDGLLLVRQTVPPADKPTKSGLNRMHFWTQLESYKIISFV